MMTDGPELTSGLESVNNLTISGVSRTLLLSRGQQTTTLVITERALLLAAFAARIVT
ncbi:hypothetical protein NDK25_07370 [Niallia taxi]|nr:hypothetical protein [Niallia taxi]MDE5052236.1 hypothetical protein [Niallia taxi]